MPRKGKKKSFDKLPEIGIEKDIPAYLEKVGNAVFETFEKYNLPPTPIGEWGLLSQANSQEFWKRMQELQEQFHQKKIPRPLDLIQAQAILPHLTRAEKSLVQGNCEELAFSIASIVNHFSFPSKIQPQLAGQKKSGKKSPLTRGITQLAQYAEDSPESYPTKRLLELIEILADDERFRDLNNLELEPDEKNQKVYWYKVRGEQKSTSKRGLMNAIYRQRKHIRKNTS